MFYETLEVSVENGIIRAVLNRTSHKNSLNSTLIKELNDVLDYINSDDSINILLIEGKDGYFCTGMDFDIIAHENSNNQDEETNSLTSQYMALLERLSSDGVVTIAVIDGQVLAGGVGIVAACDFAIATDRTTFSLSEALWGLLPCMVMPYLIRKSGFQFAKSMTLTTIPVNVIDANKVKLIDEITENPRVTINNLCSRIKRLDKTTIANAKKYLNMMEQIPQDKRDYAVNETSRLFNSPKVRENITNFVEFNIFPWESK